VYGFTTGNPPEFQVMFWEALFILLRYVLSYTAGWAVAVGFSFMRGYAIHAGIFGAVVVLCLNNFLAKSGIWFGINTQLWSAPLRAALLILLAGLAVYTVTRSARRIPLKC
jgi:hypothetical protein